jgi:ParB family chromosome partitioning protein
MGDPAPAGKVVDFTAARDGATKGKPPEKAVAPDKGKQADKAKDAAKPRRGRPPKADKAAPDKAKPQPRDKMVCTPSSRQRNNLHFTRKFLPVR